MEPTVSNIINDFGHKTSPAKGMGVASVPVIVRDGFCRS